MLADHLGEQARGDPDAHMGTGWNPLQCFFRAVQQHPAFDKFPQGRMISTGDSLAGGEFLRRIQAQANNRDPGLFK